MFPVRTSNDLGDFYFRWLENSIIDIDKMASIPLIDHLNWDPY